MGMLLFHLKDLSKLLTSSLFWGRKFGIGSQMAAVGAYARKARQCLQRKLLCLQLELKNLACEDRGTPHHLGVWWD